MPAQHQNLPKSRETAIEVQLSDPSWIRRHVALCRISLGINTAAPSDRREQLEAALKNLSASPQSSPILQLLRAVIRRIEMHENYQLKNRGFTVSGRLTWKTDEAELEYAQLLATIHACLREHARTCAL